MDDPTLLLIHAAATWALVGLIWIVQLVQYPLFARVGEREFRGFHQAHCDRIVWIVAPLMGTELLTGIGLVLAPPEALGAARAWIGLGLIGVCWAMTAFVSVPLHARLGAGRRSGAQERLVWTNWIRTAAWSARGVLLLVVLRAALASTAGSS